MFINKENVSKQMYGVLHQLMETLKKIETGIKTKKVYVFQFSNSTKTFGWINKTLCNPETINFYYRSILEENDIQETRLIFKLLDTFETEIEEPPVCPEAVGAKPVCPEVEEKQYTPPLGKPVMAVEVKEPEAKETPEERAKRLKRERDRRYRQNNKEKIAQKKREYRQKNKDKINERTKIRRANKKQNK